MDIKTQLYRSLDYLLDYGASKEIANQYVDENKKAKKRIMENLFDGRYKIEIPLERSKPSFLANLSSINNFIDNQIEKLPTGEKKNLFLIMKDMPERLLGSIYRNEKLLSPSYYVRDVYTISKIFKSNTQFALAYEDEEYQTIKNIESPSPKLSKQIRALNSYYKKSDEFIDMVLTVFSQIQNFRKKYHESDKLILSVHPLDFITMSYNDYGWSSCTTPNHAMFCSTLSNMLDFGTIVAYVESGNSKLMIDSGGFNRDPFYWSNKKARCLVHLNDYWEGVTFNRMYPHFDKSIRDSLIQYFSKALNISSKIKTYDEEDLEIEISEMSTDDIDVDTAYIGSSESYYVGDDMYCVRCGVPINYYLEDGGFGYCDDCMIETGFITEDELAYLRDEVW